VEAASGSSTNQAGMQGITSCLSVTEVVGTPHAVLTGAGAPSHAYIGAPFDATAALTPAHAAEHAFVIAIDAPSPTHIGAPTNAAAKAIALAPAELIDAVGTSPTATPAADLAVDPTCVMEIGTTPMDIDSVGDMHHTAHGHSPAVDLTDSCKPPSITTVTTSTVDTPLPVVLVNKVWHKYLERDDNVLDFRAHGRCVSPESKLCEWVNEQTIEQRAGEHIELRVGTLKSRFAARPKDVLIRDLRRFHDTTWLNEDCITVSIIAL
jgi:hypothetical protein